MSKDDEKIGESVSIETQKLMLTQFCQENGFSIFDYYVDDGFSGLNFQRPGFQKMLEDVEAGKIDTVITKDLSRLGRDYVTGQYFELLRRGYDVAVRKIGTQEIDFIATKDHEKTYFQVTDDMTAESTRQRELAPLKMVRDNYRKVILAMHTNSTASVEGIEIIRLIDFLTEY